VLAELAVMTEEFRAKHMSLISSNEQTGHAPEFHRPLQHEFKKALMGFFKGKANPDLLDMLVESEFPHCG
jgi:hypothetical protein